MLTFARFMHERGQYKQAKTTIDQALIIAEPLIECEDFKHHLKPTDVLSQIYYTYGALAQLTNQHKQGFEAHRKFLDLRLNLQQRLPNCDELLAVSYNEIGNDFMQQKRYKEAETHYIQSIETYRKLQGYTELMLALPAANLGLAYWLQGKHEKAAQVVDEAIRDRESKLGHNDTESMK
jgi:tetratricopeptide (TPR) repeat protein